MAGTTERKHMSQPESLPARSPLSEIEKRAAAAAQQEDLSIFSAAGLDELTRSVTSYIHDLIGHAKHLAEREGLDGVSATHVERARGALISRTKSKVHQAIGNFGAVLLGV